MSENRSHLKQEETWDLATIFATDQEWENE